MTNDHKWPCDGCGKIINGDEDDYLLIGEYQLFIGEEPPECGDGPPVFCSPECVAKWIKELWDGLSKIWRVESVDGDMATIRNIKTGEVRETSSWFTADMK